MEKNKKNRTLYAKVDMETHRRVRVAAAEANLTLRAWVEDAVNERLAVLALNRMVKDGDQ